MSRARLAPLLGVLVLVLAGCTTADDAAAPTPEAGTARAEPFEGGESAPAEAGDETSAEPGQTGTEDPESEQPESEQPESEQPESEQPEPEPHPISVAALMETDFDGRGLRVGEVLDEAGAYTRYAVTYRSQGLRISGIMNVPSGRGPFPVLVLNHGYIEPDSYVTGQGLAREQDWLARRGYVVLHTDYRNHAGSSDARKVDYRLRLPYAVDAVNAVRAVKRSDLRFLDGDRVGMLGRSMGGAVTLTALVAERGLVDAAVVYASTSSLAADNWRQFSKGEGDSSRVNARMQRTYGLPGQSPRFWRAASPRPYLDSVDAPVLLHHGTLDDTCPIRWSRETLRALREEGKQARLIAYEGEGHTMYGQWPRSMRRTTAFFDRHLR